MTDALVLVDLQNDFLPGGALAVPQGDEVVDVANSIVSQFKYVFATQDWHPQNHGSFASQYEGRSPGETIGLCGRPQVLWPDHCIQGSLGASFSNELELPDSAIVVRKGTDITVDSYSGFFDNGQQASTGLSELLQKDQITRVFVMGLATDYCVRFTALDSMQLGFETLLIEDGCRAVNLQTGDDNRALDAMRQAGVKIVSSSFVDVCESAS